MAINKDELLQILQQLPESAQQSAYDFIQYLAERNRPDWDEIARMEPDNLPLSEEEKRQLSGNEGYITGEDAKREFNLQVDLP